MSSPTIPRSTVALLPLRGISFNGMFVNPGEVVIVDAEDAGRLIAIGDCSLAPAGSRPDHFARLRPEEPAPPAPVRMLWTAGSSSRQFNGVSVSLGDVFEVDPLTASGLEHDQVAERVDA